MELKPVAAVLDALPPLNDAWRDLVAFAARYYQRSLGEIALAALPPQLRDLSAVQLARRLKRQAAPAPAPRRRRGRDGLALTAEQASALARFEAESGPFLLFGSTGSGKTEVYLQAVAALLARDAGSAGAGDGARDQSHAAARSALQGAASAAAPWSRCTAA